MILTLSTVRKQSLTTSPRHGSMSAAWRPQHPEIRRTLRKTSVQPKLTVGAPNDEYEREADRVADQVMRIRQPSGVDLTPGDPKIQRLCQGCEEEVRRQPLEEEEELLQTKRISRRGGLTPEPEAQAQIAAATHGGAPLPTNTRKFFETRFGQDFTDVRIHVDAAAADSVSSVNARAYTLGRDIVFGSGQYAPGTFRGKQLLAHELTHVVQQGKSKLSPTQRNSYVQGHGMINQNAKVANIIKRIPATTQPVNQVSRTFNSNALIQRQEQEPALPETPTSAPEPVTAVPASPDVNVGSVEGENNTPLNSTLASSPQLVRDLFALDPTRFNLFMSSVSPTTPNGPLAPINPTSSSRFFPNIPSTLQPSASPGPTVPSEFSLFSAGLFHFRLVFEEPSLNVSEALRESEQRFSQFVNPPSPGIDTGKLIKGLITNFLTQTPPGQAILQGVTGAFSSGSEESEPGPTVNINLDVLPSPVLQGRPPSVMLNIQGTF